MSKTTRLSVSIALAVLLVGSLALMAFTITRPGNGYDPAKVKLDVRIDTRDNILTAAYKLYGDKTQNMWVARTLIKNTGKVPVYDFSITYGLKDFTDDTSGETYPVIAPGETIRDYCWPSLDGSKIEKITTKTPVELVVSYKYRGLTEPVKEYKQVSFLGKNDFIFTSLAKKDIITFTDAFDNYRFISAFITPNEDTTKTFANMIAGGLETRDNDNDVYSAFLKCFDTLRAHGVKYIQEPPAFWAGTEAQYVQYPRDTINRKTGTCLDLAITFAALMEAVGIKSYVALLPGHAIPVIELPNSGDTYAIEATFVDQEYATSHFPDDVSPDVTASECINIAKDELDKARQEGKLIMIDPSYWWEQGVVPSW